MRDPLSQRAGETADCGLRTRRDALAAATGLTAGAVAACAMATHAPGAARAAEQPAQLTYVHQWDRTDPHGRITEALVARFNEQHPQVQVQTTSMVGDYYFKLVALIAAGLEADVATCSLTRVAGLVRTQAVVPVETLYDGASRLDADGLVPAVRDMATFGGILTVAPYFVNATGLATNLSLYEQQGLASAGPPGTWEELLDQAQRIAGSEATRRRFWGTVFPRNPADLSSPLFAFIWQNGGDLVDMEARRALWTSPEAIEALQWQVDLVHRHRVAAYGRPADGELGDVGIWYVSSANLAALRSRVRNAFAWGTAELPSRKGRATTVGGHALAVIGTDGNREGAWRFVHWLTSPAINAEYVSTTSTLPPWRSTEQHPLMQDYAAREPRIQPFQRMLGYARPFPKLPFWEEVVNLLDRARVYALDQSKTVREALEDAAREAQPLIERG